MIKFVNEGLKLKGFKTQFESEDPIVYHEYLPRPEFDEPHPGPIGAEFRASDGILRRLEAVFENPEIRIEVAGHIERETELTARNDGYSYSVDVFKEGGCVSVNKIKSQVLWPPIKERKFGVDYHDWVNIQKMVKEILDYFEVRGKFDLKDDKERFVYFSENNEFNTIIVAKKRVADSKIDKICDLSAI
jgi:hypothetical protein